MAKRFVGIFVAALLLSGAGFSFWAQHRHTDTHSIADPLEEASDILEFQTNVHPRLRGLDTWQRPQGPLRVALQVGHWQASAAPEEQKGLRQSTGTAWGNTAEWEASLVIAEETKRLLEARGIAVELLPTTIPPNYWADVFLSIHADGNENRAVSGYKVAASRHDYTGKADALAQAIDEAYGLSTALRKDANITRTMRGYYAFNWRRYDHSVHPMTAAAIIETGFLTNATDRQVIVGAPEQAASGIAQGILTYLGLET